MNLNVWHGRLPRLGSLWLQSVEPPGHRARRYRALVAELRRLDADVITLQECQPQPAFTRRLAAELGGYAHLSVVANAGMRLRGVGLPVGLGTGEGVSILAKTTLRLREGARWVLSARGRVTEDYAFHLSERRVAMAATVELAGGTRLGVVVTHLRYALPDLAPLFTVWHELRAAGHVLGPPPPAVVRGALRHLRVRDQELRALGAGLNAWRERARPDAVVVAGDFNLDADAAQLVEWARRCRLVNALVTASGRAVATWDPGRNPNTRFSFALTHPGGEAKAGEALLYAACDARAQCPDHIFVSQGVVIASAGLVGDAPAHADGVFTSDHFGVMAELRLRRCV